MGAIDWVILGVIVISTLISIKRGFVKEALSLINLIVAVVLSRMFGGQLSSLLVNVIEIPSVRLGVSMAVLFFCSLIVGGLITRLFSEVIRISGLDGTDSFLGMFFGLARGGLIVLVAIAVLHYLVPVEQDVWWRESLLIPHFVSTVEWLGPMLWEQGEQLMDDAMGRVT